MEVTVIKKDGMVILGRCDDKEKPRIDEHFIYIGNLVLSKSSVDTIMIGEIEKYKPI